jgi:butyrate kinase
VRSIEQLATANEETLNRIGMGARALKMKAEEYLLSASGHGKTAEEFTALKLANEDLQVRNKSLEDRMESMAATLKILEAAIGRGVPASPPASAEVSLAELTGE